MNKKGDGEKIVDDKKDRVAIRNKVVERSWTKNNGLNLMVGVCGYFVITKY